MSTEAAPIPTRAELIEAEWRAIAMDLLRLALRAANLAAYSKLKASKEPT